jgi:UPF0716 protein FxsA
MFWILFFLFTVLPVLEIAILIKIGTIIGPWNTVLLTIAISAVGAAVARRQGAKVMLRIQENLNRSVMPSQELIDGLMIFMGGVLLFTPGLITDTIGLIFLFPLSRTFIKYLVRKKLEAMVKHGQIVTFHSGSDQDSNYHDIDIK